MTIPHPPPRGSWVIDQAVRRQWLAAKLDDVFKTAWPANKRAFLALTDSEAKPGTPFPYVCYSIPESNMVRTDGGRAAAPGTQLVTYESRLEFIVHHTGKDAMLPFVKAVAAAFDPGNVLLLDPDKYVDTWRLNDIHVQEGDQHWSWILQYLIAHEGEYRIPGLLDPSEEEESSGSSASSVSSSSSSVSSASSSSSSSSSGFFADGTFSHDVGANCNFFPTNILSLNAKVRVQSSGTLPAPLLPGTDYWMKTYNAGFGLGSFSATLGGTIIILTDDGTGVHSFDKRS